MTDTWSRQPFRVFDARLALLCLAAAIASGCGDEHAGAAGTPDASRPHGRETDAAPAKASDAGPDELEPKPDHDGAVDAEPDASMDGGAGDASAAEPEPDGDAGGDAAADSGVSADAACAQLVAATCDWFRACRAPGADCTAAGPTQFVAARCATTPAAVEDGRARLDPDALDPCLQEMVAASSSCSGAPPPTVRALSFGGTFYTECSKVFAGTAKLGDACYPAGAFGTDGCAEGYCVASECPGTCTAFLAPGADCTTSGRCARDAFCSGVCRTYLQLNEDCSDPFDRCDSGLYCAQADHRCRTVTALGEPCTLTEQCGGYACTPEGEDGALVCFARVNEDVACHADDSCASQLLCVDGKCARQVETGERCHDGGNCPAANRCIRAQPGDALGSCEPLGGVGEPCSELGDLDCQTGLFCDFAGTPACAPRAAENESCTAVRCLETLWCDPNGELCRAFSGEGGSCYREGPQGCVDGLLCMGDGKCHAQGTQPGDPCSGYSTQTCAPGLSCDRATQTCVTLPGENDACNQGEEQRCQSGLWCACDGQPCDGNFDPWSGNALERCLPQVALGKPCVDYQQCLEGSCSTAGTCELSVPCTGP